jgi:drug/metabolite transporter (DMT)-like permease
MDLIQNKKILSVVFMILCVLSYTAMNFICKFFSNELSAYQLLFFRSFPSVLICLFLMKRKGVSFLGNKKGLLVFRAVAGMLSAIFFFEAISIIPIGTSIILKNLEPFFALLLSFYFFGYKFNWVHFYAISIASLGIFIVLINSYGVSLLGITYMVISALVGGFAIVFITKIGHQDSPLTIVFYLSVFCSLLGSYSFFEWQKVKPDFFWYLISIGVLNFLAQFFLTMSFQLGDPRKVAPIKYIEILLAMLLGTALLGESYLAFNYLGAVIFILALVINVLDFNKDGKINSEDFQYLLEIDKSRFDLNKDGKVNFKDLLFLFKREKKK